MLQNTAVFAPLITFAPQKFQAQLSDQKKKKFPFFRKGKIKRLISHEKIKTQESLFEGHRPLQDSDQKGQLKCQNQEVGFHKASGPKTAKSLNQNAIEATNRTIQVEKLKTGKLILPNILQQKKPHPNDPKQRRSISSDTKTRNIHQPRHSTIESKNRYPHPTIYCEALEKKLISLDSNEIATEISQKLRDGNHSRTGRKTLQAASLPFVENGVLEAIRRMKIIYN